MLYRAAALFGLGLVATTSAVPVTTGTGNVVNSQGWWKEYKYLSDAVAAVSKQQPAQKAAQATNEEKLAPVNKLGDKEWAPKNDNLKAPEEQSTEEQQKPAAALPAKALMEPPKESGSILSDQPAKQDVTDHKWTAQQAEQEAVLAKKEMTQAGVIADKASAKAKEALGELDRDTTAARDAAAAVQDATEVLNQDAQAEREAKAAIDRAVKADVKAKDEVTKKQKQVDDLTEVLQKAEAKAASSKEQADKDEKEAEAAHAAFKQAAAAAAKATKQHDALLAQQANDALTNDAA